MTVRLRIQKLLNSQQHGMGSAHRLIPNPLAAAMSLNLGPNRGEKGGSGGLVFTTIQFISRAMRNFCIKSQEYLSYAT